ncbi:MAG: CDP-alcohol phosphatidyltransferase family protein [Gemmatimonadota bacterium]|nr:CDP-alcohol phosphatidyltransferase family protein [Gemmatimonadota bacterium]
MPSIYDLKPRFQALLRPLVNRLASFGITPNQITVAALALSMVVGGSIAMAPEERWRLLLLPVFLFIRMALNALDGMMARELGMESPTGAFLNELGDVLSDAALYLPLALVPGFSVPLMVAIVVLAGVSELAGVVAAQIGASRRYDGPMGKSDRAFVFGALGLVMGLGLEAGPWTTWGLALVAAALVLTVVNRARSGIREAAR